MATPRLSLALAGLVAGCGGLVGDGGGGGPPPVCGDGEVTGDEVCDDGVNDALDGGCLPGCRAEDRSDEIFDTELLRIELELDPADWEALRHQAKTRHSAFGSEDCRSVPVPNPYTWVPARLTVDGVTVERIGMRKKGHIGSQSTRKPSLKLHLDEYVDDQRLLGLDRLALNNSKQDPSFARTCLSYRVFRAAGLPAPRCTFAHVTINGQDMGAYIASEEIKRHFLRRRFADPDGTLWEGTASDFRPGFIGGFERETPGRPEDDATLEAVMAALDEADDESLEAALEPLVDLDQFHRFWAAESLIWHRDGYGGNANNFFVYADPGRGGRLVFIPWGPDAAFQLDTRASVPDSVLAFSRLAHRLYSTEAGRARYYDALDELLETAWDEEALAAEIARVAALVAPLQDEIGAELLGPATEEMSEVVRGRRGVIAAAREGGEPGWTEPLRALPCRIPVAPVAGTFSTRWGTVTDNAFESGTGSLEVRLDGEPEAVAQVGARAGVTAAGVDRVNMVVDLADGRRLNVTANLPDARFFEPYLVPGTHPLLSPPLNMSLIEQDRNVSPPVTLRRYEIGEGTWTFDEIGTGAGDRVTGSFEGTLYLVP